MKRIAVLLLISLFVLSACGTLTGETLIFETADPGVSVAFLLLPAPAGVDVPPLLTPDPEAVVIDEEEAPQIACEIKANVGSSGNIYHLPGGVYYDRVKVDISQGDFWACTEQEAIDAGFRKSTR